MSPPEPITEPASLTALPALPRDAGGPVFAEPWQAEAFALAVRLSAQGYFTWQEWATTLARELAAAQQRAAVGAMQRSAHAMQRDAHPEQHIKAADKSLYYQCWLTALETLVVAKGLIDTAALLAQKQAWAEAYRITPHGSPVALQNTSHR
ncbi:MAG: nitrile hydratase accessory protein [Steroidobacteraceae bacterium]